MLTLLGVAPVDFPTVDYDVDGTLAYDNTSDLLSIDATPFLFVESSTTIIPGFFVGNEDLDINILVDDTGALIGGTAGDDFILIGDLDTTGDFIPDYTGTLLTGEVLGFGFQDSGGTTDLYDFRFQVTGGALASLYAGKDLGVTTTSEGSTFTGDFTVDFGGSANGKVGAIDPEVAWEKASIGNYVFIDYDENGIQGAGDFGINGVTVQLLDDQGGVVADTVTADDGSGNAGYYLFAQVSPGDYSLHFVVPEGVTFTTPSVGDDLLDSDVDANGDTPLYSLAAGDNRRDVDAGVLPVVTIETVVYKVQDYVNYCQKKKAGKVEGVTIEYSEDLDELFVQVDVKAYRGRLTDGFTIVITDGEWVTSGKDKFAIFYFDADVYGNNGSPVLNVFGYNGKYNAQSFRDANNHDGLYNTPDPIATSLDNSSGWVKDLTVETDGNERTMSFRIVASTVNEHVPLRGGDWEGAEIGDKATFALDTYDRLYARYNSDGFLTRWCARYHGWMDGYKISTQQCVIEVDAAIEDFFTEFGWEVSEFSGDSDGDPPTSPDDETSDEQWEGSVDTMAEMTE